MFIGHFAVGLAAKKVAKKISLGTLFLASQFIDLIWPLFLLLGLEHVKLDPGNTAFTPLDFVSYPFTHSMLSVFIWAFLFGLVYFLKRKNLKGALLLGTLVISHWILDLITHRPDLPLTFWNNFKVGLGLWNSIIATVIVEGGIFVLGSYLYFKVTKAQNKIGSVALWGLLLFLVVIYISNLLGPPPPSAEAIGVVGLSQWLLVAWAYWIDKNRVAQ